MKSYLLQELAAAMNGALLQAEKGGGELRISAGVSTDTRSIPNGALFFALKGENFDAHHFLDKAAESGAGALVIQDASQLPSGIPAVLVDDTLRALQSLAQWYRAELGLPVVAITGSNGKTSTKDFTKSVLSQKFRVNATLGNLNNHIGLPLTVLAAENVIPGGAGSRFDLTIDGLGSIPTSISVAGKHMVSNALLAAAAGHVLGLSLTEIAAGLESVSTQVKPIHASAKWLKI